MTPFRKLTMERKISRLVALFPVMQLEKLTDLYFKLFPQTGYHVSANDLSGIKCILVKINIFIANN